MAEPARLAATPEPRREDIPDRTLRPSMTVGDVAFVVLRNHFAEFLKHRAEAMRSSDPEHLHDTRVSTRRMRAAVRLFDGALSRGETERFKAELRYATHALGEARDLDVQIEQTRRWKAAMLTVEPEAIDPLLALLQGRLEAARSHMIAELESERFHRLESALHQRLGCRPSLRRREAASTIARAAPKLVGRIHRKLVGMADSIAPSTPLPEIHQVRLRAKRMRYALEFLEPLYGKPAAVLIGRLVRIQDAIGVIHDDEIAVASLQRIAHEEAALPAATLRAIGELAQLHRTRAERLRGELPRLLRKLHGSGWRRLKKRLRRPAAEQARA